LKKIFDNFYLIEPGIGFCLRLEKGVLDLVEKAEILFNHLCDNNIPHNMILTTNVDSANCTSLRLIIFPRNQFQTNKLLSDLNIAFCELSGYVTTGCKKLYETLEEETLLSEINSIVRDVTGNLVDQFKHLLIKYCSGKILSKN